MLARERGRRPRDFKCNSDTGPRTPAWDFGIHTYNHRLLSAGTTPEEIGKRTETNKERGVPV